MGFVTTAVFGLLFVHVALPLPCAVHSIGSLGELNWASQVLTKSFVSQSVSQSLSHSVSHSLTESLSLQLSPFFLSQPKPFLCLYPALKQYSAQSSNPTQSSNLTSTLMLPKSALLLSAVPVFSMANDDEARVCAQCGSAVVSPKRGGRARARSVHSHGVIVVLTHTSSFAYSARICSSHAQLFTLDRLPSRPFAFHPPTTYALHHTTHHTHLSGPVTVIDLYGTELGLCGALPLAHTATQTGNSSSSRSSSDRGIGSDKTASGRTTARVACIGHDVGAAVVKYEDVLLAVVRRCEPLTQY